MQAQRGKWAIFAVMGAASLASMECDLHWDGLMAAGVIGDRFSLPSPRLSFLEGKKVPMMLRSKGTCLAWKESSKRKPIINTWLQK